MRFLDKVYAAGIILAAIFMVLIAGLTLAQVIGRLFGIVIPDAGDIAGYCMAGATFLALAHTFRSGGHIRVNLLLTHVPRGTRRVLEVWCVLFLCVVGALFRRVRDQHGDRVVRLRGRLDRHDGDPALGPAALDGGRGRPARDRGARGARPRAAREEPHYARAEGEGFTE
jgi:hypothetical protein